MDSIATLILVSSIINGVDPKLLTAICTKESNLKAVNVMDNGSYSYGPCQVKKIAAKQVGLTNVDLTQPEQSIDVAAKYLKYKLNKCRDTIKAIGAYNSGKCYKYNEQYVIDVLKIYIKEKEYEFTNTLDN